jgi:3-hydroxyacyl-[acyl-carrier-protein] dehydratase
MWSIPATAPAGATVTRTEIERLIPHRDPFLWIDEVDACTDRRIVARKRIPEDLDVFRGHYPHFPVLPGVLQCEAAFQAGAILIAKNFPPEEGQTPVVTRLNNTQFRRMVRPGELLMLEVELTEKLGNAWFLKGKVSVDGQVTVRLEFACAAVTPGA